MVIDGDNFARAFDIVGKNVTIKNINFINTSSSGGGAICYSGDDGVVSDCTFSNTNAESGGAIYWVDGDGVVSDCTFSNTNAESGGAIHWASGDGVVSDCTFTNITAKYGGAIYCAGVNDVVSDCTFSNTNAESGGAIYCAGDDGVVSDCTFTNTNSSNGGAIYCASVNDVVSDCTFTNTTASICGGAIYCFMGDDVVSNCTFINTHSLSGGAIYGSNSNDVVSNCTFINTHSLSGGAIYWINSNGVVSNCTFTNSTCDVDGSAICMNSFTDPISSLNITGCSCDSTDDKTPIYNDGIILSPVEITTMGGENKEVTKGELVNLTAIITDSGMRVAGGVLTFTVNGTELNATSDKNGLYSKEYTVGFVGTKPVNAIYNNSTKDLQSLVAGNLTSPRLNVTVTVDNVTGVVDDNKIVTVTVIDNYGDPVTDGVVTILWNGKNQNQEVSNGTATFNLALINAGEYPLTAYYNSSATTDYNDGEGKFTVIINQADPQVNVDIGSEELLDIKFGDTVLAMVDVPERATGTISFSLDNETWITKPIPKDTNLVEYRISGLDLGNYILFVKYSGDGNYNPVYSENPFSVDQFQTIVTVDPVKGKAGEKVKITARVTDERGNPVPEGTVIIGFNGKEYKANVVNGIATVEVVLPKAGTYSATAYYEGINYNSSYTTFTVEVSDIPGPNPDPNPVNPGNMENTGNPLLVLLIALAAIGLESLRRKF